MAQLTGVIQSPAAAPKARITQRSTAATARAAALLGALTPPPPPHPMVFRHSHQDGQQMRLRGAVRGMNRAASGIGRLRC